MSTIIAAVVAGLILLWGGTAALLRLVDALERKHVLALGAYTSAVAALVIGLVLFNAHERQKEHRAELQEQMEAVTKKLSDLSERLVGQLSEKAELTASEFEIRADLQTERAQHANTREALAATRRQSDEIQQSLAVERKARLDYQEETNRKLDARFSAQDERSKSVSDLLDANRQTVQGIQKLVAGVQSDVSRAHAQLVELANGQKDLLGKLTAARQVADQNAQKLEALARSHAALHDGLGKTIAQVDSLYNWKKN